MMGNCCSKGGDQREGSGDKLDDKTAGRKSASDRTRMHPMVKKVTDEVEFAMFMKDASDSGKILVVDFFAIWCGPCQLFSPQVERFAEEFAAHAIFVKINVEECEELSISYEVTSLPKFIIFKNGKVVDEYQGVNAAQLRKLIALHVPEEVLPAKTGTPPRTATPPE